MVTIYGIKTCTTVKKAQAWLDARGTDYRFHDYRVDGLDPAALDRWIAALGFEALVNKRSTTWRELDDAAKASLDEATARSLMVENPTLIKRPLWDIDGQYAVGFDKKMENWADANVR